MPFEFERQKIKDVILIKPKVFGDNRGFFMETYKKSDLDSDRNQKFLFRQFQLYVNIDIAL